MLLKVVGDHEMKEIPIAVKVLHVDIDYVGGLDAVAGFEGAFDGAAGFEVADLDAIESLSLARLDHFVLDNRERIAVDQNAQTRFELVGRVAGHFSSAV